MFAPGAISRYFSGIVFRGDDFTPDNVEKLSILHRADADCNFLVILVYSDIRLLYEMP